MALVDKNHHHDAWLLADLPDDDYPISDERIQQLFGKKPANTQEHEDEQHANVRR